MNQGADRYHSLCLLFRLLIYSLKSKNSNQRSNINAQCHAKWLAKKRGRACITQQWSKGFDGILIKSGTGCVFLLETSLVN